MSVDNCSCATIIRSDMLPSRVMEPKVTYILETSNGQTISGKGRP